MDPREDPVPIGGARPTPNARATGLVARTQSELFGRDCRFRAGNQRLITEVRVRRGASGHPTPTSVFHLEERIAEDRRQDPLCPGVETGGKAFLEKS